MHKTHVMVDMLLSQMPDDVRAALGGRIFAGIDDEGLVEIAGWPSAPADALEILARSPKARVRAAVALNPNCPQGILQALATDRAKTVAGAAQRRILWAEISAPDGPTPQYTRETAVRIETLLQRDYRWQSLPGTEDVLGRLLCDDAWLADHRFVRLCYETLVGVDYGLLRRIGPSRFARALLDALPQPYECENALEWLWEQLPPGEFLPVLHDNEDALEARAAKELGRKWKSLPLRTYAARRPPAWFRIGLTSASDTLLFEAFNSDSELLIDIAAAQARQRPHLQGRLIELIMREWEEYSETTVQLFTGLTDDGLLDLPVELIFSDRTQSYDHSNSQRAREVLARSVSDVLRDRPEAWDVLRTVIMDYDGTARELLAALRTL